VTRDEPRRIAVKTELVLEHLISSIVAHVEELYPGHPPDQVADRGPLAIRGYLARIAETDMFAAARAPTRELGEALRLADGAVGRVADELASREPVEKPSPDDDRAFSWRVPGPGGHVRHLLALAAVQDAGLDDRRLKREWMYGFAFRCCEEALGLARRPESV
jgi:hypothetical protein